jgi:hypothetical protein
LIKDTDFDPSTINSRYLAMIGASSYLSGFITGYFIHLALILGLPFPLLVHHLNTLKSCGKYLEENTMQPVSLLKQAVFCLSTYAQSLQYQAAPSRYPQIPHRYIPGFGLFMQSRGLGDYTMVHISQF